MSTSAAAVVPSRPAPVVLARRVVPGVAFDPDDDRVARAAWSRLAEPGDVRARQLVLERGAGSALRRVLAGAGQARWRARLADLDPARDLATVERFGARWIVPGDDEWPPALAALGVEAPFGLFVRGPLDLAAGTRRAVSMVGSRACSNYGHSVAASLAAGCAERGITVVSGAAFGIDGAAHKGALASGGATVAVLACGIDRIYPRGHDQLIQEIGRVGAVVTEIPPGSSPTRWRFVERNRLVAALAQLVVVVEAAHRSGTESTASRAGKVGVTVAAVPGPVTSPTSYGTNRLLRDGAVCVTSAMHIDELVSPIGTAAAEAVPDARPKAPHDGLAPDDLRVYDALPVRRPAPVESLVTVAGLEPPVVRAALGRLELAGLARRAGPGWLRAVPPRAGR